MTRAGNFIIGLILGAIILWVVAIFVHLPKAKSASSTTTSPQSSSNNQSGSSINTATQALVSGFPANVPVYDPSSVVVSTQTEHGNDNAYNAVFSSSSQPNAVISFYRSQLNANGWHLNSQSASNQVTLIKAAKGNERLNLVVTQPLSGAGNIHSAFQLDVAP